MSHSLQYRVAWSSVLIVGVITALMALSAGLVSDMLEDSLTGHIVQHQANAFAEVVRHGGTIDPPESGYFRVYVVADPGGPALPERLRGVAPGLHTDLHWNNKIFQVYRREVGDKLLYVTYDVTAASGKQALFSKLLFIGVLLAVLLAVVAGIMATHLALVPLTRLTRRIRQLSPETRGARLGNDFNTVQTRAIAAAFDRYLKRLDELIDRERSFTTAASHELRTPLAVIQSTAELLQQQTTDDARLTQKVERIARSAKQLSQLTESLLLLARDDQSTGPVRIHELLAQLTQDPSLPVDAAARIRVTVDSPLTIQAPITAVATIVHNLVVNALRHAPSGPVEVTLHGRWLCIRDHGPGLPHELSGHVFERGTRTQSSVGMGLGLYISRQLCDRCGWHIELSPAPGGGARARVKF